MTAVLGIDVAKRTYQATLLVEGHSYKRSFGNHESAFPELLNWLHKHYTGQLLVGMEATGRYWEALAYYLHAQGHVVSVINPSRISYFARSKLVRNKTDAIDATLIAEYCLSQQPEPWTPPPAEVRELQALVRHLEALQGLRTQQSNRLQAAPPSCDVRASLESLLSHLDDQIRAIESKIREHMDQHPTLKQQSVLLQSIPGIGQITAARLLGENIQQFDSTRALTAYAGLTPRHNISGTSVHGRPHLCKTGNEHLRRDLYFPAIVAMRYNPVVNSFSKRLSERGKHKMAVVGAAMRKLLAIALGVLKSETPFDPHYNERNLVLN
jgi:transposase